MELGKAIRWLSVWHDPLPPPHLVCLLLILPSCPAHHPLFHLGEGGSAFPKQSSLASFLLLFLSRLVAFLWWGLATKLVSPPVLHPPRKVQNVQIVSLAEQNRRVAQSKGEYMYTHSWFTSVLQQKLTQHCKAINLQKKIKLIRAKILLLISYYLLFYCL